MSNEAPKETRDERYKRQTNEQFEMLGRYVQRFESMVNTIRNSIVSMLTSHPEESHLLRIIVHHHAMSAGPLFEVFRALTNTIVADPRYDVSLKEKQLLLAIFKDIADRYGKVVKLRNKMLHGTWFIGWANRVQDDFSQFNVRKHVVSGSGLDLAKDTPKNIDDLKLQIDKCLEIQHIISSIEIAVTIGIFLNTDDMMPSRIFYYTDDKWISRGEFHG